jgi:hypothetical protein
VTDTDWHRRIIRELAGRAFQQWPARERDLEQIDYRFIMDQCLQWTELSGQCALPLRLWCFSHCLDRGYCVLRHADKCKCVKQDSLYQYRQDDLINPIQYLPYMIVAMRERDTVISTQKGINSILMLVVQNKTANQREDDVNKDGDHSILMMFVR